MNTPKNPAVVMSSPQSPSVPAVAGGGEDGARLDWLEKHGRFQDREQMFRIRFEAETVMHHTLRQAIDAAIAATKAKEGKL